ncbi:hypothetical protein BDQ17DRAFT_1430156 [Cyathus striatus]|nr:hypothetical protein BDQ17DRAFT_1430156 [Cyathus striatus]
MAVNNDSTAHGEPVDQKLTTLSKALDISVVALQILQSASQFSPIPGLREVSGLCLSLVNAIVGTNQNKDTFIEMARDACTMISQINEALDRIDPKEIIEKNVNLTKDLDSFIKTLNEINELAIKEAKRRWITRFFLQTSDLKKINQYKSKLSNAIKHFNVKSIIDIRGNMSLIMEMLHDISDILKGNSPSIDGAASNSAGRDNVGRDNIVHENTAIDNAGRDHAGHDNAGRDNAGHHNVSLGRDNINNGGHQSNVNISGNQNNNNVNDHRSNGHNFSGPTKYHEQKDKYTGNFNGGNFGGNGKGGNAYMGSTRSHN